MTRAEMIALLEAAQRIGAWYTFQDLRYPEGSQNAKDLELIGDSGWMADICNALKEGPLDKVPVYGTKDWRKRDYDKPVEVEVTSFSEFMRGPDGLCALCHGDHHKWPKHWETCPVCEGRPS